MKEFLECTDQPAMIWRWSIKRGEGEERIYLWLSMIKMLEKKTGSYTTELEADAES